MSVEAGHRHENVGRGGREPPTNSTPIVPALYPSLRQYSTAAEPVVCDVVVWLATHELLEADIARVVIVNRLVGHCNYGANITDNETHK